MLRNVNKEKKSWKKKDSAQEGRGMRNKWCLPYLLWGLAIKVALISQRLTRRISSCVVMMSVSGRELYDLWLHFLMAASKRLLVRIGVRMPGSATAGIVADCAICEEGGEPWGLGCGEVNERSVYWGMISELEAGDRPRRAARTRFPWHAPVVMCECSRRWAWARRGPAIPGSLLTLYSVFLKFLRHF